MHPFLCVPLSNNWQDNSNTSVSSYLCDLRPLPLRSARDLELERRIKLHTTMMKERRQRPKGTPQEEMEAAKQELEMVGKFNDPNSVHFLLFVSF